MTAILWANNKLMVDSSTFNGVEWVDVNDKVILVRQMLFIQTDPDKPGDPILAFSYTGAKAQALVTLDLIRSQSATIVDARLEGKSGKTTADFLNLTATAANAFNLINDQNTFKVVLIGKNKNYLFDIEGGLQILDKAKPIALGSSSTIMQDILKEWDKDCSPIYAIVNAITKDPLAGGRIFQYEVVKSKQSWCGVEMVLSGLYEEPNSVQRAIFSMKAGSYEPEPDLILNPASELAKNRIKPLATQVCKWGQYVETFKRGNNRKKKE